MVSVARRQQVIKQLDQAESLCRSMSTVNKGFKVKEIPQDDLVVLNKYFGKGSSYIGNARETYNRKAREEFHASLPPKPEVIQFFQGLRERLLLSETEEAIKEVFALVARKREEIVAWEGV